MNYKYYETMNMMKYENKYLEIIRRLRKVISRKLRYLFSSKKL